MTYFCRQVNEIKIGKFVFTDLEIDFGDIDPMGEIQGLIGLDVLKSMRAVIDVEIPQLLCKKKIWELELKRKMLSVLFNYRKKETL